MGLFSRRPRQESMDPALTFMTVAEADEVRRLTLAALDDLGIEAHVDGGDVHTVDGGSIGLWNVATICGAARERNEWPGIVEEHIRELVTAVEPVAPEDMDREQLRAALRVRLAEESYVRGMPEQPAACETIAPGLVRHLVLETTESILPVPESVLAGVIPSAEAVEAAQRATLALVEGVELESQTFGQDAAVATVVFSTSPHVATLALDLPRVVERLEGRVDPSHGIVFAVPTRQQIVYHVPSDPEAVRSVLPVMLRFAGTAYDEGAGALSPELYVWQDGRIDALTAPGEDGRVQITPTGRLAAFLDAG